MIQFKVDSERCNQCEECVRDCPRAIIEMKEGLPTIAADKEEMCIGCQHCLTICKPGAISILGKNPDESTTLKGNLPSPEQMETLIRGRRSTRRYKNKSVDPATISHLLEVTANAPTGVNNMGTLFTVVDDLAVMDKIRRDSYVSLEGHVDAGTLPERVAFFASFLELWEQGVDTLYRGAPHMLITSSPAAGPSPQADCFIALSYFELLANSMGLGTVWCGLGKWMVELLAPELKERMGVPEDHQFGYMMMFGHPTLKYHRTVQRGPVAVNRVSWE